MPKQKDLVALLVDCGSNMSDECPDGMTYMEKVKACLTQLIEQKIFCQSRSEYVLVAFSVGAENLEPYQYPFIAKLSSLGVANLKMLSTIKTLTPMNYKSSLFQALNYAAELLTNTPATVNYDNKKIGVFTNFSFTLEGHEAVHYACSIAKPLQLYMNVVCRYGRDDLYSKRNLFPHQSEFAQLLINLDTLASVYTIDYALANMSYLEPSEPVAAPWHTKIFIGSEFSIPVTGYIKTIQHKSRSWSKAYIEPENVPTTSQQPTAIATPVEYHGAHLSSIPVSRNFNYSTSDGMPVEINKEEISRAYVIGSNIIQVTGEDEIIMKYRNTASPAVRILYWTNQENVKPFFFVGNKSMIFIPDIKSKSFSPTVSFTILAQAMLDTKCVAIVSMIRVKSGNPQIGCLSPCFIGDSLILTYNQLPFAEDIRYYSFAPLLDHKNRPEEIPSNHELDLMDNLIQGMSLVEKDGKNVTEYLLHENINNPFDKIQFQAILYRYMNPDKKLDPAIFQDEVLETPPHIIDRCQHIFREIKNTFKLIENNRRGAPSPSTSKSDINPAKRNKPDTQEEEQEAPDYLRDLDFSDF